MWQGCSVAVANKSQGMWHGVTQAQNNDHKRTLSSDNSSAHATLGHLTAKL